MFTYLLLRLSSGSGVGVRWTLCNRTHHTQQRAKRGQNSLIWQGVTGSRVSAIANIKVNFESVKLTRLLSCGVQSAWRFWRHVRCITDQTRVSWSNNKYVQVAILEPFDDSCMWNESRIYGRWKLGSGAIRHELYFAHHTYGPWQIT